MKILFKNARILKMDDSPIFIGDLLVEDNKISKIGNIFNSDDHYDRVIECNENLIMPGFKNAHSHNGMSFLRSGADDKKLEDWLFNYILPREDMLDESIMKPFYQLEYLELIKNGITSCLDYYFFPKSHIEALKEIGYRAILHLNHTAPGTNHKHIMELIEKYNDKKDTLIKIYIGAHAVYTSNDEYIDEIIKMHKEHPTPFYVHIAETEVEMNTCKERYNCTPIEYYINRGLYDCGGGAYHSVWLTDNDIQLCKKYNISVISCPSANAKLASGMAPLKKYLDNGLNVCLGTDGPAGNNSCDMFKEMVFASYVDKLINHDSKSIPAIEFLKMATVYASKAMRLENCDTLNVGQYADIIMLNMHDPNMQPINNIINNIVYSGNPSNVILTMINGKVLYENGCYNLPYNIDEIYSLVNKNKEIVEERLRQSLKK